MKTYKVVGTQPIFDCQPGDTFTQNMDPEHEKFLVSIGGIETVEAERSEPVKLDAKSADLF